MQSPDKKIAYRESTWSNTNIHVFHGQFATSNNKNSIQNINIIIADELILMEEI